MIISMPIFFAALRFRYAFAMLFAPFADDADAMPLFDYFFLSDAYEISLPFSDDDAVVDNMLLLADY